MPFVYAEALGKGTRLFLRSPPASFIFPSSAAQSSGSVPPRHRAAPTSVPAGCSRNAAALSNSSPPTRRAFLHTPGRPAGEAGRPVKRRREFRPGRPPRRPVLQLLQHLQHPAPSHRWDRRVPTRRAPPARGRPHSPRSPAAGQHGHFHAPSAAPCAPRDCLRSHPTPASVRHRAPPPPRSHWLLRAARPAPGGKGREERAEPVRGAPPPMAGGGGRGARRLQGDVRPVRSVRRWRAPGARRVWHGTAWRGGAAWDGPGCGSECGGMTAGMAISRQSRAGRAAGSAARRGSVLKRRL